MKRISILFFRFHVQFCQESKPDLNDPKTKAALMNQLRRMCQPKPGSRVLDVPQAVADKFKRRGAPREELLNVFVNECKQDKVLLICFQSSKFGFQFGVCFLPGQVSEDRHETVQANFKE